ncbi:NAD-dependent epimerase/dehydratase family protein, partial [Streptosporangium algeriense]
MCVRGPPGSRKPRGRLFRLNGMTIIVTGSSGLLGSALTAALRAEDARVVRLVRREPRGPDEAFWNPAALDLDPAAVAP